MQCFPIIEARSFSNDYEQNNKQKNEINHTDSFAWEEDQLFTGQVRSLDAIVFHVHENLVWGKLFNFINPWELFLWCLFKQLVPYKLRDFLLTQQYLGMNWSIHSHVCLQSLMTVSQCHRQTPPFCSAFYLLCSWSELKLSPNSYWNISSWERGSCNS